MTSSTSPASTPARAKAARNAMAPSDWAERVLSAPLKLPTGVRVAETMTMSFMLEHSRRAGHPAGVAVVAARCAGRKMATYGRLMDDATGPCMHGRSAARFDLAQSPDCRRLPQRLDRPGPP